MTETRTIEPGMECWTPFEPRGKVKVLAVSGSYVEVEFLHDHAGYRAGSQGRYFIEELTPVEDNNV